MHIRADYIVTPNTAVKNQADFQALKSQMSSQYVPEVKNNTKNTNWKTEIDQNITPKSSNDLKVVPEPYCSGKKGAVIGRCDHLQSNCNQDNYRQCQCNGERGNIEKCSKYILFCCLQVRSRYALKRNLPQASEIIFRWSV